MKLVLLCFVIYKPRIDLKPPSVTKLQEKLSQNAWLQCQTMARSEHIDTTTTRQIKNCIYSIMRLLLVVSDIFGRAKYTLIMDNIYVFKLAITHTKDASCHYEYVHTFDVRLCQYKSKINF